MVVAAVEANEPGTRSSKSPIIKKTRAWTSLEGVRLSQKTNTKQKTWKVLGKFPSRSILLFPEVSECEALHTSFRNSHPNNWLDGVKI